MKKTILVTGANGQLGSELRKLSNTFPFHFIFTDVEQLNITDKEACKEFIQTNNCSYIINCAAYTAVDKAETDKEIAFKLNAEAVRNLAQACKENDSFFFHISTDYVFDGKNYQPYKEGDKINPQSEYGRTKVAGENFALEYSKSLVIRTAWLYSEFGNNFVKTMVRLGKEKESLNVVFDQVGTPTLAFDLAHTILEIISKIETKEKEFVSGIYHYSNEGVCSWFDFATAIMTTKKLNCKVHPIETKDYPTPAQRPHFSVLNKAKIKNTYGIDIPHWLVSLEKTLEKI